MARQGGDTNSVPPQVHARRDRRDSATPGGGGPMSLSMSFRSSAGCIAFRPGAGIRGQVCSRGERAGSHIDQESRCGPDPDSRHAGQDWVKRSKHSLLDFSGDIVAPAAEGGQLLRKARQDDRCDLSARDHDGLFREGPAERRSAMVNLPAQPRSGCDCLRFP